MKERGISFSPDMASAAYADRKTMTRRVFTCAEVEWVDRTGVTYSDTGKPIPSGWYYKQYRKSRGWKELIAMGHFEPADWAGWCPYGAKGDRLYVRTAWRTLACYDNLKPSELPESAPILFDYIADEDLQKSSVWGRRRAARFLPKRFAAFWLEIVSVSVDRLQDISLMDCIAEGVRIPVNTEGRRLLNIGSKICAANYLPKGSGFPDNATHLRAEFAALWDGINGDREGCSWESNCWVWVISFRRVPA